MSWDIAILKMPAEIGSVIEIPADFKPEPLGTRSAVTSKIKDLIPTVDFSDPYWGLIDGDGWSIELSVGKDEQCYDLTLHVRGGDEAIGATAAIIETLSARAIDLQTAEFFVPGPDAIKSFQKWRSWMQSK